MLRVLGAVTGQVIHEQVFAAATGMHGAGGYGAQCGLVEGGLMFLGVWGREMGKTQEWITEACNAYAQGFERRFGSLLCRGTPSPGFYRRTAAAHVRGVERGRGQLGREVGGAFAAVKRSRGRAIPAGRVLAVRNSSEQDRVGITRCRIRQVMTPIPLPAAGFLESDS